MSIHVKLTPNVKKMINIQNDVHWVFWLRTKHPKFALHYV